MKDLEPMGDETSWRPAGDRALVRPLSGVDLQARNRAARALYRRLLGRGFPEVEDVVPAASSVFVLLRPGSRPSMDLVETLNEDPREAAADTPGALHEIDVRYGGEDGPDLSELARLHGLAESDVVALHASVVYTVAFVGFSPGFAYLVGLPKELHSPRLPTPRTRVPAGSVAIGGEFTGIYPRATPGGWRILGQSDVSLFDPHAERPARFLPGDRVRFVPR